MAYSYKFRLASIEPRNDGSGGVIHDVWAVSSPDGVDWTVVPGRHKSICIPASELETVMDMADATAPQKTAKNTAYKDALASNLDTQPVPVTGWTEAQLDALMAANDAATLETERANDYITVTLGLTYPVDFAM